MAGRMCGKLVMATQPVTIARIYLREGEHRLGRIIELLHDEEKVSGVTVLQGVTGFGPDGQIRTASLLDLSLDLPIVVEFYDLPERVAEVIAHLETQIGLSHVVSWSAVVHLRSP